MNFYAVLGISRDADDETIRSAYRLLARRYHPDRGAGSSTEKFRRVNEAYETLMDPGSRQAYDLSLQWPNAGSPFGPTRWCSQDLFARKMPVYSADP